MFLSKSNHKLLNSGTDPMMRTISHDIAQVHIFWKYCLIFGD